MAKFRKPPQHLTISSVFEKKHSGTGDFCVYAYGGCELDCIFDCEPRLLKNSPGVQAIVHERFYSGSRSDFILQGLRRIPNQSMASVIRKFDLPPNYFQPILFEPICHVQRRKERLAYPKRIIVLSITADIIRPIYRHKKQGFLIDPGALWYRQPLEKILSDLETIEWFWKNFENIGRMRVQDFSSNFKTIVGILQKRKKNLIMVFNGRPMAGTALKKRSEEFNAALTALSREMNFQIIDIHQAAKTLGCGKRNFRLFPKPLRRKVASELVDTMRHAGYLVQ